LHNTAGSFVNADPFLNIMDYWYWTSVDFVDPNFVMVFTFRDLPTSPIVEAGWEDAGGKYGVTYTWLVRDATNDPIPTPEPSSLYLLLSGLAAFGICKRRSRISERARIEKLPDGR
jgi:PEP-CTERM motif